MDIIVTCLVVMYCLFGFCDMFVACVLLSFR